MRYSKIIMTDSLQDSLAPWDYPLPDEYIARHPTPNRDGARLLVMPQDGTGFQDKLFTDLPSLLKKGDLVIGNDSRVMRSRLFASRTTGGQVELLVLSAGPGPVPALLNPSRRLKEGEVLSLHGGGEVSIVEMRDGGIGIVKFEQDVEEIMEKLGSPPIPPYLKRDTEPEDVERYQTIYAGPLGSSAAPTAGLHFSQEVLDQLEGQGIGFRTITLHVGLGTFRPLKEDNLLEGRLHPEAYAVSTKVAKAISETRENGGRVIAIGTTVARVLEACTPSSRHVPEPGTGVTDVFIRPPYSFRTIDGLLTNFHLPQSSLMMLVGALCGRERLLESYKHAIAHNYRFYSYGDAMLLI